MLYHFLDLHCTIKNLQPQYNVFDHWSSSYWQILLAQTKYSNETHKETHLNELNCNRRFSNAASANDNDFIGLGVTGWSARWLIVSRHIEYALFLTMWLLFFSHAQYSPNGTNYTRQHITKFETYQKTWIIFKWPVQIFFVLRFEGIQPKWSGTNVFLYSFNHNAGKEWKQKDLQSTSESKTLLKRPQKWNQQNPSAIFFCVSALYHSLHTINVCRFTCNKFPLMHDLSPIAYYTVGENNLLCIRISNTNAMECMLVVNVWVVVGSSVCVIYLLSIVKNF